MHYIYVMTGRHRRHCHRCSTLHNSVLALCMCCCVGRDGVKTCREPNRFMTESRRVATARNCINKSYIRGVRWAEWPPPRHGIQRHIRREWNWTVYSCQKMHPESWFCARGCRALTCCMSDHLERQNGLVACALHSTHSCVWMRALCMYVVRASYIALNAWRKIWLRFGVPAKR